MATVFAITTANDTLKLDPGKQGEALFTITNSTSRPLRGLAKLKPLGNTKQEWLKLAGESERDFPAGGTQQFAVGIEPPANTPPGTYSFRLDVVSTLNPDEDFTEGPTVTAEVLPPKPPPPSKAWMIPVALIVVLLVVGAIVWLASRSKKVEEPQVGGQTIVQDVTDKTLDQAKAILEGGQHLHVTVAPQQKATFEHKEGKVADQNPTAGSPIEAGGTVILTLTGPTTQVPPVIGQKLQSAMQKITDAELNLNPVVGGKLDGDVQDVKPGENSPVLKGTKVTLFMPRSPCITPLCTKLREEVTKKASEVFEFKPQ